MFTPENLLLVSSLLLLTFKFNQTEVIKLTFKVGWFAPEKKTLVGKRRKTTPQCLGSRAAEL